MDFCTDETIPTRKYPRAKFHDYNCGVYFVTVCTHDRQHYFGAISQCEMKLSELGMCLERNLLSISEHLSDIEIPMFVIMPNHFHAVVTIKPTRTNPANNLGRLNQTARLAVATGRDPTTETHHNSRLAVVVGSIKAHVSRYARKHDIDFRWQPRFHEHIIRNNSDGRLISDYIGNNVARWEDDRYHS